MMSKNSQPQKTCSGDIASFHGSKPRLLDWPFAHHLSLNGVFVSVTGTWKVDPVEVLHQHTATNLRHPDMSFINSMFLTQIQFADISSHTIHVRYIYTCI